MIEVNALPHRGREARPVEEGSVEHVAVQQVPGEGIEEDGEQRGETEADEALGPRGSSERERREEARREEHQVGDDGRMTAMMNTWKPASSVARPGPTRWMLRCQKNRSKANTEPLAKSAIRICLRTVSGQRVIARYDNSIRPPKSMR